MSLDVFPCKAAGFARAFPVADAQWVCQCVQASVHEDAKLIFMRRLIKNPQVAILRLREQRPRRLREAFVLERVGSERAVDFALYLPDCGREISRQRR